MPASTSTRSGVPHLADVARLAGVSVSTASRALSGEPSVAAARVRQIRAAAEQIGYAPDPAARALRTGTKPTIAVILPELGRQDCSAFLRGLIDAAEERGLSVIVASCGGRPDHTAATVRAIRAQRPVCVVVVDAPASGRLHPALHAALDDYRSGGGRVSVVARSSATTAALGWSVVAVAGGRHRGGQPPDRAAITEQEER
ncbi:MAG TPA: LacI family DNA-binding transcriptional regulator [Microlunatus sp.]|nr:LacI family DNA-binding transcriptional regulator [Microlunatus sp.]